MSVLIEVEELAEALAADAPPVLLDVRWNLTGPDGHAEFLAAHLPGAEWIDLDHELAGPVEPTGGRHPLPSPETFRAAMRRTGVRSGRPVVAYDAGNGLPAARLWWLLRFYGFTDVRVLNGGLAAWQAAGHPVESGEGSPADPGDFSGEPGALPVAAASDVGSGATLWDVRAPERYRGDTEPIDPVAGHIPGARNLPSTRNHRPDGRFLPAEELRQRLAHVREGDIVYCGSGVTAAQTLLACEAAGITGVRLYPGSWSDWITDPARPVGVGEEP